MTIAPTETLAFVDAIEAGQARLLIGEQPFTLPVAVLPPDDGEVLRDRLGAQDPGGDLKL